MVHGSWIMDGCTSMHMHVVRWEELRTERNAKKAKATPGLPMWSPTIVLTGLDRA